ncbi:hypothetical protein R1flu_011254 [Riccia fluitans]|uniref:Uncharacterized protein n=1 Tax=Riccia fluitans TaxID=41844 RepID=A0ABD1ZBG9_9MARC
MLNGTNLEGHCGSRGRTGVDAWSTKRPTETEMENPMKTLARTKATKGYVNNVQGAAGTSAETECAHVRSKKPRRNTPASKRAARHRWEADAEY